MPAVKPEVQIPLAQDITTTQNGRYPTKQQHNGHNYPIRHAPQTSHRIPFTSVYNPRHSDPLDHHYQSLVHELQEILTPAISTVLKKMVAPTDTGPIDPDKNILVSMDVHQFSPEELTVKMKGNELVIEGNHEDKHDGHGFISRKVVRRISIPNGVERRNINCDVNKDGVLDISVPNKKTGDDNAERTLPIHYTRRSGSEVNIGSEKRHYQQETAVPVPESKVKNGA